VNNYLFPFQGHPLSLGPPGLRKQAREALEGGHTAADRSAFRTSTTAHRFPRSHHARHNVPAVGNGAPPSRCRPIPPPETSYLTRDSNARINALTSSGSMRADDGNRTRVTSLEGSGYGGAREHSLKCANE
jgi:hypothetical protein